MQAESAAKSTPAEASDASPATGALPEPSSSASNRTSVADGSFPSADEIKKIRDPFKRPESDIGPETVLSDLERYSVDSFKMIAVLTGPTRLRAMLESPDGKTFLVGERMKIGPRRGVVTRITEDSVKVREQVQNVLGQDEDLDTEIHLKAETRGRGATAAQVPVASGGPLLTNPATTAKSK